MTTKNDLYDMVEVLLDYFISKDPSATEIENKNYKMSVSYIKETVEDRPKRK